MPKYATNTTLVLADGRSAVITAFDDKTNEYMIRPNTPKEGETRTRASRYTEDEVDALMSSGPKPAGRVGTPANPAPITVTFEGSGDTISGMGFLEADGYVAILAHEHPMVGAKGSAFDPKTEFKSFAWTETAEVVVPEVVKPTPAPAAPTPAPVRAPAPAPAAVVPVNDSLPAIPEDLMGFASVTGESLDDPRSMEIPRLQLAQGVLEHQKKGWQLGDLMYADLVISQAKGTNPARIGWKADPVEFAVLRLDGYWVEDVPFSETEKGYEGAIARTLAEKNALSAQGKLKYPWRDTADLTGLLRKPDGFNDTLGLFSFTAGNAKFGFFRMPFLSPTAYGAVVRPVNTAAKMYLKGRLIAGRFTLGTETKEFKNISTVPEVRRVGVWDDATLAGLVEILRAFAKQT